MKGVVRGNREFWGRDQRSVDSNQASARRPIYNREPSTGIKFSVGEKDRKSKSK